MTLTFKDDILLALRGGSLDTLRLFNKLAEIRSGRGETTSMATLTRELEALQKAGKIHGTSGYPTYYSSGRVDRSQEETR